MPGLQELEAEAAAAQQAAAVGPRSGRVAPECAAVARVLRMGAVMVVQDALELAKRFPNNPIHKLLMGYQSFRWGCKAVNGLTAMCVTSVMLLLVWLAPFLHRSQK
eukprot:GHRQ01010400.1.p4 GENE.GHRQ01010400.1~~GHRQ01010400.1.p4  ORF type:complete len:106 (+),score=41.27 GHRQ01010400.1:832-1149(+)